MPLLTNKNFRRLGTLIAFVVLALILRAEPQADLAAHFRAVGQEALQNNHLVSALDAFGKSLRFATTKAARADTLLHMARIALRANRPDLAEAYIRLKAAESGVWGEALTYLAFAETSQSHPSAAAFHAASLAGVAADIPSLHQLVKDALLNSQYALAEAYLKQLTGLTPDDGAVLYQYALMLTPYDPTEALRYLYFAAKRDRQYQPLADKLAALNAQYQQATAGEWAMQVGLAFLDVEAWPYAEYAFRIAIKTGYAAPQTLAFLAIAQDNQGRDSWPTISRALDASPNDAMVNYAAAVHWRLRGNPNFALEYALRAQAIAPQNPALTAQLGLVYQAAGRLNEAHQWLSQAVAMAPNDVQLRVLLVSLLADNPQFLDKAKTDYVRAQAEQYTQNADIQAMWGWLLYQQGRYAEAARTLQQAVWLSPNNLRARYYFGVYLEYAGNLEAARQMFASVANQRSSFRLEAERALQRLP
jgi:tetratricopeptide (TPR) repeat protein